MSISLSAKNLCYYVFYLYNIQMLSHYFICVICQVMVLHIIIRWVKFYITPVMCRFVSALNLLSMIVLSRER